MKRAKVNMKSVSEKKMEEDGGGDVRRKKRERNRRWEKEMERGENQTKAKNWIGCGK